MGDLSSLLNQDEVFYKDFGAYALSNASSRDGATFVPFTKFSTWSIFEWWFTLFFKFYVTLFKIYVNYANMVCANFCLFWMLNFFSSCASFLLYHSVEFGKARLNHKFVLLNKLCEPLIFKLNCESNVAITYCALI
jgi:hypothetical protein